MISLVISLTTTPMLCAMLLPARNVDAPARQSPAGWLRRRFAGLWRALLRGYGHALDWTLTFPWLVMLVLGAVIAVSGYLFVHVEKGFFPDQDNGQFFAGLRADQS